MYTDPIEPEGENIMKGTGNITFVDNTGVDSRMFYPVFSEAYKTRVLPEEYQDLFRIEFLREYNEDGSDRMLIFVAE